MIYDTHHSSFITHHYLPMAGIKKWLLFFLILLHQTPRLSAQFTFGLRLGTSSNWVNLSGDPDIDVAPRISGLGLVGIMPGWRIAPRLSVDVSLHYLVKGYDDLTVQPAPPFGFGNKATGFRFRYAGIAPQITWHASPEFKLHAGGYADFMFERQKRDPGFSLWKPLPDSFDGFFRTHDIGATAGCSVCYKKVCFWALGQIGIAPIASFNFRREGESRVAGIYNRTFATGIGIVLEK
jgi:hypothetical protein